MSLAPDVPCEELGYNIQLIKNGRTITRGQQSALININYSRVLDNISTAGCEILTPCTEACGELPIADHWNTDFVVTHGPMNEVMWRGPVTKVRYRHDRVLIEAKDLFAWATKRVVPVDVTQTTMDVSEMAAQLWELSVNSVDAPSNEVLIYPQGITESRETKKSQHRKLWNLYTEMLNTGLDITTFGSRVLFGLPVFQPMFLTDAMIQGDVEVVKDGDDMANYVYEDAAKNIVGIWPPGPRVGSNGYPLLEESLSDSGIQDQISAENAARARYNFSAMGIRRVVAQGGLVLQPAANIDHKKLIAGQLFNFAAGEMCYSATETLRLGALNVSIAGGLETATIDLQPLGSFGGEGTV